MLDSLEGNDFLYFDAAVASGSGNISAFGVIGSTLITGVDGDSINISAAANGTAASWIADPITGGVQWSTNQAGASLAVGLGSSSVDLGDGDDNLSVSAWASGADPTAIGILDSTVQTGSGNDSLSV